MKRIIFLIITLSLLYIEYGYAESFGIGIHAGYGILKYEEMTSSLGTDIESRYSQPVILSGISGEYSLKRPENFYINLTTDWVWGLEGEETWKEDDVEIQRDDMRIFGQFYDLRVGYKNVLNNIYFRFYISGGWDGLRFKRKNFIINGTSIEDEVKEDFSLPRGGIGGGIGFKIDKWAIDGRLAYSYYPDARIENDALPGFVFKTDGLCLDMGAGVASEIKERLNFYLGFSYTLLKLNESDVLKKNSISAVFPESRTEIMVGVINLSYAL